MASSRAVSPTIGSTAEVRKILATKSPPPYFVSHKFDSPLEAVNHFAAIKNEVGSAAKILLDCNTSAGAVLKSLTSPLDGAVFSGSKRMFEMLRKRALKANKILLFQK